MDRTDIIKKLIKETGLNLKSFSEKAGLPYTTLRSMLERGIGNASVDNVIKVCKALGITVDDLEDMSDNEKSDNAVTTIAAHFKGKKISEEKLKRIEKFIEFTLNEDDE